MSHPVSSDVVVVLVGVITTLVSWLGAAFIAGQSYGSIKTDVKGINERLARIEGMFEMKLKD